MSREAKDTHFLVGGQVIVVVVVAKDSGNAEGGDLPSSILATLLAALARLRLSTMQLLALREHKRLSTCK